VNKSDRSTFDYLFWLVVILFVSFTIAYASTNGKNPEPFISMEGMSRCELTWNEPDEFIDAMCRNETHLCGYEKFDGDWFEYDCYEIANVKEGWR